MNLHMRNSLPRAMRRLAVASALLVAGQASAATDLDLAIKMGCLSCHRGAVKLIGPPYKEVASKYAGAPDAVRVLAEHIVKGTGPAGMGWMKQGRAALPFMPPNTGVTQQEAEQLATWVLAMKGEIPGLMDYVTTRLSVSGAVEHALDLGVEDLRAWPAKDVKELSVASQSPTKAGVIERFKGVPLRALLEKAVLRFPDHHDPKKTIVIARASDGYAVVLTWSELFNSVVGDGVLVYFERDGVPLAEDEGRIAMISLNDTHRGGRHIRWLKSIEVRKAID